MKSLDILREEHRTIEQMLIVLDRATACVESGGALPSHTDDLLDFFERFADAKHHAKEEHRLFPALTEQGFGEGVVEAMRHQHEMGRIHVRDMRHHLARLRTGDGAASAAFATSAHAYSELLRVHIQIEDEDVYPMAERTMTAEQDRALCDLFAETERTRAATDERARWDSILAEYRATPANG